MSATGTPPRADSDSGARPFATVNPYTGETVREFPFLETEQIPSVVERADKAFHAWRKRLAAERAQVVRRAGDLILERKEQLAALLTEEVGKLIRESEWEVGLAASILQYYAERGTVAASAAGRLENSGQSCVASNASSSWRTSPTSSCPGSPARSPRYKQETPPTRPPRWAQCHPSGPPRTSSARYAMPWTRAPRPSPAAGGPNPKGPSSTRPCVPMSALGCAYSEELFGPVAIVYCVADDNQAVELANATSFGPGGLCSAATCSARGPCRPVRNRHGVD
jgi:hypothetical protein